MQKKNGMKNVFSLEFFIQFINTNNSQMFLKFKVNLLTAATLKKKKKI